MGVGGRCGSLAAASLFSLAAMVVLRGDNGPSVRALAPVEIVASGFEDLAGVAVDTAGAILVTDRRRGTLTRIDRAGHRHVLLDGLHRPTGVAVEPGGSVLVIEHGGKRLLRRAPDGSITVAAASLRQARSVAVGPDGNVWVSMRRAVGGKRDDGDKGRRSKYVVARLDESGALAPWASGFMDVQGLAADEGAVYITMARLATERGRLRTGLARLAVRADGSAGPVEPLLRSTLHRPRGVTIDAAGDVFVSGAAREDEDDDDGERTGVILKRQADARVSTFAAGLYDPVAMAFTPNGDLVAVEKGKPGRVLRFRAPRPPRLAAPAFTNRTPLALNGHANPGARVAVSRANASGAALTFTVADATTGAFTLAVPLTPNATNGLSIVATGLAGAGLVSTPARVEIVHDDVPPSVTTEEPVSGAHTRGPIFSSAQAEDDRSGVAALLWSLNEAEVARVENPTPEQPFAAAATLATHATPEGPQTLHVTAVDRAGNSTSRSTLIIVDRTPPETLIVGGPAAQIVAKTATFVLSGTDDWSDVGVLDYAWRFDEGPWSAFDAAAFVQFNGLAAGAHRFEVRARDRAGNEDLTPAEWAFTVVPLQIRITEPAPGANIVTPSVWVRGVVEGGSGEVTVSLALPSGELAGPVEGRTFAIEAPADPLLTTLTVVATDAEGDMARTAVSISLAAAGTVTPSAHVWPPGGLAPLTVRMGLEGLHNAQVAIDIDSDGTTEFEGLSEADDRYVTYTRPGIYVPTVRYTDDDGTTITMRSVVEVYDRATLNGRLQAIWQGFKEALRAGNIDTAVSFIVAERRPAWTEYFHHVPSGAFVDVDRWFTTITLVNVGYGGAQYEMVAERDGLFYSYAVWFQIDADGRWRLWRF